MSEYNLLLPHQLA